MFCAMECVIAVKGHPRSLILVPIESACATSYWSSTVTSVLSCPLSMILQVFCSRIATLSLFHANFGIVPLGLDCRCWGSEERRPYICINTFKLTQLIHHRHRWADRQTDRRTNRRTEGRLAITYCVAR